MKIRILLALLLAAASTQAADLKTLSARPGSKMRIEGTANMIHTHWAVESPIIGGSIEVGPNFPTDPGQTVSPGPIEVKGGIFVTVQSLKSVEDDGSHYSDSMDDIMYAKLLASTSPRITFHITELALKEAAKDKDSAYTLDAKGEVAVAGVTNTVSFPVNVLPMAGNKIKISGNTSLKMSAFKIEPPAPKIALGMLKTGDDVKIIFNWIVAPKAPAAAAK